MNHVGLRSVLTRGLLLASALALGVAAERPAHAGANDVMIGYVNLQRAILEVEEGKRAKSSLKSTFEQKQKALNDKETELLKLKESLEKQMGATPDEATKKKALEFQGKLLELRQTFMAEQQSLAELEQKELAGITTKMRGVIDEIGKAGNYTLILEVQDSRLLYARPHLDLTNEVIRKYNSKHK